MIPALSYETQQEIKLWVLRLRRLLQREFDHQLQTSDSASMAGDRSTEPHPSSPGRAAVISQGCEPLEAARPILRALEGRQAFAARGLDPPKSLSPFQGSEDVPPPSRGSHPWLMTAALPGLPGLDARGLDGCESTRKGDARECAYTLLMRLVALKCMEARDLLFVDGETSEVITTRTEYGGLSRLLWQMRSVNSEYQSDAPRLWRDGLTRAFGSLALEFGSFFDEKGVAKQAGDGCRPSHACLSPPPTCLASSGPPTAS